MTRWPAATPPGGRWMRRGGCFTPSRSAASGSGRAGRITLELQDWFVPALYQAGHSAPLLTVAPAAPPPAAPQADNLAPVQESGFHGRRRELWTIERWFTGGTRRIVLSGFGGQGKTYLAEEAGRWLRRTGMFERVCFVGYASFQGSDAVAVAVSTLATVLGENLIDAAAAGAALARVRTLLILDNLESRSTMRRSRNCWRRRPTGRGRAAAGC